MAIALPSIADVVTAARRSAARFPLVLAAALVTTVAGLVLVDRPSDTQEVDSIWTRLMVVGSLGLPLLFAVASFLESRQWPTARVIAAHGAALIVLGVIAYAWSDWTNSQRTLRYALFSSAFHFAAAFLRFVGRDAPNEFWQYNRVLFLRFLTSALYVLVLFVGLSAALGAINVLFKANIAGETFGRLFIIDAVAFGTWFFLSGIPDPLSSLATRTDYPDGLRRFSQYVLIPLVVVYLLILTTYLVKVLFTREWPSGWIGYLVSFVTITGMLAWLLVRPLEERPAHAWVKGFTRGFFIALLPSIAMLWMALYKRVDQYGLTERRVIALAGALWLSSIAVFYIASRSRNIKLIPMTLCLLILPLSAGPVSAFALSRRDQMARLEQLLTRNELLKDGRLVRTTRTVTDSDAVAISESVWYLRDAHGTHVLDAWLSDSVRRQLARGDARLDPWSLVDRQAELVMTSIGLPFNRRRGRSPLSADGTFEFNGDGNGPFDVVGYEHLTHVYAWSSRADTGRAVGGGLVMRVAADSSAIQFMRDSVVVLSLPADSLVAVGLRDTVPSAIVNGTVRLGPTAPPVRPPLMAEAEHAGVRVQLLFNHLSAKRRGTAWLIRDFHGYLLLGTRPQAP